MDETRVMRQWVAAFRHNSQVAAWLKNNPPPAGWQGTALEWAYTEMPLFFTLNEAEGPGRV